ncbi:MFS transporter [Dawidia soli]|uniref:MFS transporter n=1 Tax=Dawidia soli TaxID=2782352 RepID=A0AAP2GCG5_9BACT|nr:MFS transporter [Dawidia soli]MBT1686284.1 MFS transporter [Dawidia soli]
MATVKLNSTKGIWVMSAAIMASSMAFIDGTALNVVLPALQAGLHATSAELFWILNAYLLMLASLILIGGSLSDKLGRKKIFMVGIFIFVVGSALCGTASTVFLLIAYRVIQGIGGAFMIPGSLALISSSIDETERGKAIGTWSSVTTVVTVGGPILGGALADAGLWRYIFFINIPIGIAAFLILWAKVDETKDENSNPTIDIAGAIVIALGLAALTFGCLSLPEKGMHHWHVYLPLITGTLLLIAFLVIEKTSQYPMMPLNLFRNSTFSGANLLTFFLYAGLGAGMLFLSLNLVQVQGYTQLQSGFTFLPFTLLMIALAKISGKLADRYGPRLFLIIGPATAGLGLLWLAFIGQTRGINDYWGTYFPGILVFGLGMSITVAPLTSTVMGSVGQQYSGTASGINNALTRISNVLANAIFGALAVLLFSTALQTRVENVDLSNAGRHAVMSEAVNLGNATVPNDVNPADKEKINKYYHESFIDAYKKIMLLSSALCFTGAFMSFLFVKNKAVNPADSP